MNATSEPEHDDHEAEQAEHREAADEPRQQAAPDDGRRVAHGERVGGSTADSRSTV